MPSYSFGACGQLLGRVRALCGHIGQPTFGRLAPIGAATLCGGPPRALPALHPSATSGAAHAVPHPSGPLARSLTHTPARLCTRSCCTQALSTHAHAHVHAAAAHVAAVRKPCCETWPTLAGGLIGRAPPRIRARSHTGAHKVDGLWVRARLKVHKLFDRKYKKNLKRLLIVHPSWTAQPRPLPATLATPYGPAVWPLSACCQTGTHARARRSGSAPADVRGPSNG